MNESSMHIIKNHRNYRDSVEQCQNARNNDYLRAVGKVYMMILRRWCSKPRDCEMRHAVQIKGEEKRRRRERE